MSNTESLPRRVSVLGATGSIGANTLDVMRRLGGRDRFDVVALTGMSNISDLAGASIEFGAKIAVTARLAVRILNLGSQFETANDDVFHQRDAMRAAMWWLITAWAGHAQSVVRTAAGNRVNLPDLLGQTDIGRGPAVEPVFKIIFKKKRVRLLGRRRFCHIGAKHFRNLGLLGISLVQKHPVAERHRIARFDRQSILADIGFGKLPVSERIGTQQSVVPHVPAARMSKIRRVTEHRQPYRLASERTRVIDPFGGHAGL